MTSAMEVMLVTFGTDPNKEADPGFFLMLVNIARRILVKNRCIQVTGVKEWV